MIGGTITAIGHDDGTVTTEWIPADTQVTWITREALDGVIATINEAVADRDRARDIAVALEQEVAQLRESLGEYEQQPDDEVLLPFPVYEGGVVRVDPWESIADGWLE